MDNSNFEEMVVRYLHRIGLLLIVLIILLCYQCANIVSPKGGPKDEQPPLLDTINSSINFQINYEGDPIILSFDEWIVLQDVFDQVVVSPPTEYPMDIKIKKKSVVIQFDEREILKENTTYTINMGNSIKDYTEGNIPPNLRYVFSTGDIIDSLEVSARLIDIETKKPIENALLMLYTNLADSVLYTEKPFYFAKSDTGGLVNILNVRADTFKVVALVDDNLNYLLDGESEKLAFLDSSVIVNQNSTLGELELYTPKQPMIYQGYSTAYGKVSAYFNQNPKDVDFDLLGDAPEILFQEYLLDSLILWYADTSKVNWSVIFTQDTLILDTLDLELKNQTAPAGLSGEFLPGSSRNGKTIKSDTTLVVRWDRPLKVYDEDKIILSKDSIANSVQANFLIDSFNPKVLVINSNWEHPGNYFLRIDESAVQDIFGVGNDSIGIVNISAAGDKAYGSLKINFNGLDSLQYYHMQLIAPSGEIVREASIHFVAKTSLDLLLLEPGNYTIRLIEDVNQNKEWDPGDYQLNQQSERIFIKEMPPLRANWEQTIDFNL
ncbi:MAG: Ig-like domain-containing protein [Bacteroidia bacterium]|nr:Ig-like domain-containing protein [Bacteroidia bacterium]